EDEDDLAFVEARVGQRHHVEAQRYQPCEKQRHQPMEGHGDGAVSLRAVVEGLHAMGYLANTCFKSPNALNSSALPEGSRKNIVACSPTWPLKRTCGSITNLVPADSSLRASASHWSIERIAPKWRTGTLSPSTALVLR